MRRKGIWFRWIIVFGVLFLWLGGRKNYQTDIERNNKDVAVTAHRGGANMAPENTIAAIETAIRCGARYVEMDVRITADGIPVIMHDKNLVRTTGYYGLVSDTDWSKIQTLEAGGFFEERFYGEPVPTLEEALHACQGRIIANIELKDCEDSGKIVNKTVDLIQKLGMENECFISSRNLEYLKRVKTLCETIRTGYIGECIPEGMESYQFLDFFSISYTRVSNEMIRRVHKEGKELHVWTVNSVKGIRGMERMGVDNIITDIPLAAVSVLRE